MLSNNEKILIRCLKIIGMTKDEAVAVMYAMDTVEKQDKLAEFLMNNKQATAQDTLREAFRISKMT
jgi:predicted transcriptional regulator